MTVDAEGRATQRLGGLHPGGVVLATADGQSHFVLDQELIELLPALSSISGGETVDPAKLDRQ
jgi:hypothetical protein